MSPCANPKEMVPICMIAFTPANVEIPVEGLKNGAAVNDDGHGWAVASAKFGLQVGKSMDFDSALLDYRIAREEHGIGSLALFHSRMATHGTLDEFNVHPFPVGDREDTVVAHNGILPAFWHPVLGDKRSDTRILAEHTLPRYLTDTGLPSRRGAAELGDLIGKGNKLTILTVANGVPRVRIINADQGTHSKGTWFSNTWFKPYVESTYRWSGYTGWAGGRTDWTSSAADKSWWDEQEEKEKAVAFYSMSPCEVCNETDCVDLDWNVCEACGTCLDCWMDIAQCECPIAVNARREGQAEKEAAETAWVLG